MNNDIEFPRTWLKIHQSSTGIYRWSIILADTDFFQQLISAPDF